MEEILNKKDRFRMLSEKIDTAGIQKNYFCSGTVMVMRCWVVLLLVLLAPVSLLAGENWQEVFEKNWESDFSLNNKRSLNDDSWQYYYLAYSIDGLAQMLIATGETVYLDRALYYIENTIAAAKISNKKNFPLTKYEDGYLGWISKTHRTNSGEKDYVNGHEVPLAESYLWRYVCHILRLMRETPEIYSNVVYRDKYHKILNFTEKHIWEKWYTRGVGRWMYRCNVHMASHWAYIAAELAEITEETEENKEKLEQYRMVRDSISHLGMDAEGMIGNYRGHSFRSNMKEHPKTPNAYWWAAKWGYEWKAEDAEGLDGIHGQDVSHGNDFISFLVEANNLGLPWTNDDMQKFSNTLNFIFDRKSETGEWPKYVDGFGEDKQKGGWIFNGFVKLGRFSLSLQERLETEANRDGLASFSGAAAVNARVLSTPSFTGRDVYNPEPSTRRYAPVFDAGDYIDIASPVIDQMRGDVSLSFTGTLEKSATHQALIFHFTGGQRFGLRLHWGSENNIRVAFHRQTASASNRLYSSNIIDYLDGEVHTITVNYTAASGRTIATIDGKEIFSDIMQNHNEAFVGTGSLRVGMYGGYTQYPYIGSAVQIGINGVTFPLNEGRDTVYGYLDGSQTMTGSVRGCTWDDEWSD